jgi:hypothetical protein
MTLTSPELPEMGSGLGPAAAYGRLTILGRVGPSFRRAHTLKIATSSRRDQNSLDIVLIDELIPLKEYWSLEE